MRIATMTTRLLDEVRAHPPDTASLNRLRTIDTQIIGELLTDLTPDLRQELQRLALPLTRHTELSDAELRPTITPHWRCTRQTKMRSKWGVRSGSFV
jgi:hypothetical protein